MGDVVKEPSHYAESFRFEVYQAIQLLLNTFYADASPAECWSVGNELRYRFRAGLKEDGHNGAQDIAKAMRVRQMREGSQKGNDSTQSGNCCNKGNSLPLCNSCQFYHAGWCATGRRATDPHMTCTQHSEWLYGKRG